MSSRVNFTDAIKIRENLIFLIFSISFFLASWLVANVEIGPSVIWVSAIFILLLALPSYYYLLKTIEIRIGFLVLIVFSIFPIVIEAIGISTGIPYGGFHYSDELGFKIAGLVPWSVIFAFAPLLIGSYSISSQVTDDVRLVIPFSAFLLVLVDMVLDPAAVILNIWEWDVPGPYYGIPLTNYSGWFITAIIGLILLHFMINGSSAEVALIDPRIASSILIATAFWTGFSFWTGLIIPTIVGGLVIIFVYYLILFRNPSVVKPIT